MSQESSPLPADWQSVALAACRSPSSPIKCPVCNDMTLTAAWNLIDPLTREATADLSCSSCGAAQSVRIVLPRDVPDFFPLERVAAFADVFEKQAEAIMTKVRRHVQASPAGIFTTHPLWAEAKWSATTFQWHPASEAPPVMGIVFDNAEAGKAIFREAERQMNHTDRFEEIRVSIIEGPVPGQEQRPGYSVHICPEPESLAAHATAEDFVLDPRIVPFLGQWNRMYPIPGAPALLPRFKREFEKHKEYLLAPVTRRSDGKLWCDAELGIIKNSVEFRDISSITPEDIDAGALLLPQLITPPANT